MPKTVISPWEPDKLTQSALFDPALPYIRQYLDVPDWPSITQLNHDLFGERPPIFTAAGARIELVEQDPKPQTLEQQYAPRIMLKGEIQTREHNWHDFFQAVTWAMFPKTKVAINALHYPAAQQRYSHEGGWGKRSQLENALSQFDECGAIVISSNPGLLDMIREYEWFELYWQHREQLRKQMRCLVFGHAIYEKAVHPYVGLTAKAVLIDVEQTFIEQDQTTLLQDVDALLAQKFIPPVEIQSPKVLHPLPILGLPGYFHDNENAAFYHNQHYFRPRPRRAESPNQLSSI